jgi:hypothetical protein
MTRWRADRLDRPVVDLEAGRPHAAARSPLMSKTRAVIPETLGMPDPFPTITRAVMEP